MFIRKHMMFTVIVVLLTLPGIVGAAPSPAEDWIVKINDKPITQADLDKAMSRVSGKHRQGGQEIPEDQMKKIREQMLDNLINEELLFQAGREKGIEMDSAAVTSQMDNMKKQFPDEAKYKAALDDMNMTEADFRKQIERNFLIKTFVEKEIVSQIQISDAETREFYEAHPEYFKKPEQIQASHILIKADPKAEASKKDEAVKQIKDIQAKLKNGEKFEELAKEYSECPSGQKGGDLGLFSRGKMVKPFEDAAYQLEVGQVSDIVETQFGYHIIKLTDKKTASTVSLDEAKEKIAGHLKQQKAGEKIQQYIKGLKEKADIRHSQG